MKTIAVVLVLCSLNATALEVQGDHLVLTPQEMSMLTSCADKGGCHVVTRADIEALVQRVYQAGVDSTQQAGMTCKRNASDTH